jgi:hypothetical protein
LVLVVDDHFNLRRLQGAPAFVRAVTEDDRDSVDSSLVKKPKSPATGTVFRESRKGNESSSQADRPFPQMWTNSFTVASFSFSEFF